MSEVVDRLNEALEGRYRIDRKLGEGGMATVYLADDVRHNRQVALKVLRPELAAVVGGDRFLQEIEVTASLQHPHILPLFDSGEADGFLFYVMPYVEGESLRDRLDREKQLPVEEAVSIASDVAEALHYAHGRGVVHRDVKPANILIQAGRPVVADFGIALAVQQAGGGRLTDTGLSLGTPHYMSPEQASADRDAGPRSDIYSLGCVLYEMLVGDPPYTGSTAQAVLGKILTADAVPPRELRRSVLPNVDAAVRRAVEKLPADRFASGEAFVRALEDDAFRHGVAGGAARASPWNRISIVSVVVAAAAVLLALWGWLADDGDVPAHALRVSVDFPAERPMVAMAGARMALSPDGTRLAYVARSEQDAGSRSLWVRHMDRLEPEPVPDSRGARAPVWSPGGDSLAFRVGDELRIHSFGPGGGSETVLEAEDLGFGASWSPEGGIVLSTERGLEVLDPRSGERRTIHETGDWPHWVPGGDAVTFTDLTAEAGFGTVGLVNLSSGLVSDSVVDGVNGRVLPSGHLLWATEDGSVYAQRLDVAEGRTEGGRARVLENVEVNPGGELRLSVARSGDLVYMPRGEMSGDTRLGIVARGGDGPRFLDLPADLRIIGDISLSPDGGRLAFSAIQDVNHDVWVYELNTSRLERFTLGPVHYAPRWSPGGEQLVYYSSGRGLVGRPGDRSAPPTTLHSDARPASYARNGALLVAFGGEGLGLIEPPDTTLSPLPRIPEDGERFALSPDARWLAYDSDRTGPREVWVQPVEGSGGPWRVSEGGGTEPEWGPEGSRLYYRTDGAIMEVDIRPAAVFQTGAPRRVVEVGPLYDAPLGARPNTFEVFPDERRFAVFEIESRPGALRVILETDWVRRVVEGS